MSIKAVTGLQGHGKTYETVKTAILPAIESGRRVVTNIRGLNMDAIKAYISESKGGTAIAGGPLAFGDILTIDTSQVTAIGFFPVLDDQSVYDPNTPSIVLPGDLVILDEAWRWWSTDSKIPDQHMAFWREHRHFVGGKGDTCDLIVISQSVSDLHRKLRSVIELTTICSKPKELGITSAYMCDVYSRATLKRGDYLGTHRYKYDKKIFALYKSYSGTVPGKENILDKRQNVLGKAGILIGVGVVGLSLSIWSIYSWYHSKLQSGTPNAAPQNQTPQAQAPTGVNPPPSTPVHQPIASSPQSLLSPSANANPRAVGYIRVDGQMVVVLETPEGRFRFADNVDTYRITSHAINVDIDGAKLVPWSGGVKGK
jgi:zona occludens toxin